MKITCNVIRDILPLYYERMLSEDSNALLEEHVEQCQECKACLDEMKTFDKIPKDTNTSPLQKIKSKLRKKKIQISLLSIMLSAIIILATIAFLTSPEYLPYSEETVSISEIGNGSVLAAFSDEVGGYDIDYYRMDGYSGYIYNITSWNSIWNKNVRKGSVNNTVLNPNGEEVTAVYYYQTDGSEDVLIYGTDINPTGGIITLPRYVLSFYFLMAIALTLICGFIMLIFRKNKKVFNFLLKVLFLPVSYLLGHIITKGINPSSYLVIRDFYMIVLIMIPSYLAFLIAINLISKSKNKKK